MNSLNVEPRTDFQTRCLRFSAGVLKLVAEAPKNQMTRPIVDQLLRSGTSVGANAHEARSAESRADFIHKMQIALKEARETGFWLALLSEGGVVSSARLRFLIDECHQLTAILVTSVNTARRNALAMEQSSRG